MHCALKVETFLERVLVVRLAGAAGIKSYVRSLVLLSQSLKKAQLWRSTTFLYVVQNLQYIHTLFT